MTFQYLLVAVLVGFAIFLLRQPGLGRGSKASILLLVAAMLVFSIRPEWSTSAAKLMGISRGVDLLFYVSHLALFFIAFMFFLKLKKMEMRLTTLVRQLALEPGRVERRGTARPAGGDGSASGLALP